jgi:tetratricopeptide (TPR) repeat protein
VENFNKKKLFPVKLKITNREAEAEGYKALSYFNQIKAYSDQIEKDSCGYECRFIRGILYSLVMNYNNAIMDYDAALKDKPDDILTLFNRAYVRYKMVEVIRAMEQDMVAPQPLNLKKLVAEWLIKYILIIILSLKDFQIGLKLEHQIF